MTENTLPLMFPAYAEIFLLVMALVVLMADLFLGARRRWITYALVQAHLNHCGEALQVAQQIQARIPSDDIAVANAQEVSNICEQNLVATPTSELPSLPTETPAIEEITPTPES